MSDWGDALRRVEAERDALQDQLDGCRVRVQKLQARIDGMINHDPITEAEREYVLDQEAQVLDMNEGEGS